MHDEDIVIFCEHGQLVARTKHGVSVTWPKGSKLYVERGQKYCYERLEELVKNA